VDVDIQFPHVSASAVIVITSTLGSPAVDESWGIRDFRIFTENI
jgi:hypothetical protein